MAFRKLSSRELEMEAERIMAGESSEEDYDELDLRLDNEYFPSSDSEHYSSSEVEEAVSEENEVDVQESAPPNPKKQKKLKPAYNWQFNTDFAPRVFEFDTNLSGVTAEFSLQENACEAEYFLVFFGEKMIKMLTTETNRYANRDEKWRSTDNAEMYSFLATCMLMGIVEKPALKDYWSTNEVISTPFFRSIFRRDRFLNILSNLHFTNNTEAIPEDPLRKIRSVFELFRSTCSSMFYPFQDLCIDESLILWKGRLAFKQYIPSKRHRFGIKLFEICDAESGYILDVIIYTGAKTELLNDCADIGKSAQVVDTLMKNYYDKKHILYVDNWYSSPLLFQHLLIKNTGACGTVKHNRLGMPNFHPKLNLGECETACADNMLAIKWCDKKMVHMLTTVFTGTLMDSDKKHFSTGENIFKPHCVLEYNKKMGAVDKIDMQVSFVECARKSLKWYKKLFFHLMDLALYNAYMLFQVRTGQKPSFADFRLQVLSQILEKYHTPLPSRAVPPTVDNPLRLTERHFISPVPQTEAQGSKTQRRCHVCSSSKLEKRKRKDTRYMCIKCNVSLCVYPCFERYHTLNKY